MFELSDLLQSGLLPVIAGGIALALTVRVVAGFLDVWRIGNYLAARGGKVISCRWSPFGPGWLGEKRDRIYHVKFVDHAGAEHRAYCKTSMLTGVYFTQDRIVGPIKALRNDAAHEPLQAEIARLRQENGRLRAELAKRSTG